MSLVSIITPTYNSSKYIDKTIESILSQTYQNWELIITDDFSTDDTVSIVNSYIKTDSRIKLYELKNIIVNIIELTGLTGVSAVADAAGANTILIS